MTAEFFAALAAAGTPFLTFALALLVIAGTVKLFRSNGAHGAPATPPELVRQMAEVSGELRATAAAGTRQAEALNKIAADLAILVRDQQHHQLVARETHEMVGELHRWATEERAV
jgi:hypothetical protein